MNAINQVELINVYKALHSTVAEYTFFSSAHGTFAKVDHATLQQIEKNLNHTKYDLTIIELNQKSMT